jgi:hypothetical protein
VEQIRQMVLKGCKVIEIQRKSHPDAVLRLTPASEDILYKRNKPSNVCTLLLSGRVTVLAGKDQFKSEMGPWCLLGADSLEHEDGAYLPDYTAFVSSDTLRCLLITKGNIRKCWLGYDEMPINPRRKDRTRNRTLSKERDDKSKHDSSSSSSSNASGSGSAGNSGGASYGVSSGTTPPSGSMLSKINTILSNNGLGSSPGASGGYGQLNPSDHQDQDIGKNIEQDQSNVTQGGIGQHGGVEMMTQNLLSIDQYQGPAPSLSSSIRMRSNSIS